MEYTKEEIELAIECAKDELSLKQCAKKTGWSTSKVRSVFHAAGYKFIRNKDNPEEGKWKKVEPANELVDVTKEDKQLIDTRYFIKQIAIVSTNVNKLDKRVTALEQNKPTKVETTESDKFDFVALNSEMTRVLYEARENALDNEYEDTIDNLTTSVSCRIPAEVERKFDQVAKKYNISKAQLLAGLIEKGLHKFEIDWDLED
ncbi:MAG: hypothetical protein RIT38_1096 [Bacteroidota bacterium]|jgi:hypothetical protein